MVKSTAGLSISLITDYNRSIILISSGVCWGGGCKTMFLSWQLQRILDTPWTFRLMISQMVIIEKYYLQYGLQHHLLCMWNTDVLRYLVLRISLHWDFQHCMAWANSCIKESVKCVYTTGCTIISEWRKEFFLWVLDHSWLSLQLVLG